MKIKSILTLAATALFLLPSCKKTYMDCCCVTPPGGDSTIVFQNTTNVFDAHIGYKQSTPANANSNSGNGLELPIFSWTVNGDPVTGRSLLRFALESIPAGKEIVSAKLSLYGMPENYPSFAIPQGNSGDNALLLQRVISSWEENTVTWNTQPGVTAEGELELPVSTSTWNFNITNIDVTEMIRRMRTGNNYGFSLRLKTEGVYRSIGFMSSEYSDATKRPRLEVVYKK